MAADFVAGAVFHRSTNIVVWALPVALVVSCTAAVVVAVVELVRGEGAIISVPRRRTRS
jgi:hypothetical protein